MRDEREDPIRMQTTPQNDVWSVVLAGGEGERAREFIQERLGLRKPKQYCCFVGSRSLLQHTIDRADALAPPEQRVVVVAREHREEAMRQTKGRTPGRLILQPSNRGTAPGVFLPLTYVLANASDATVVIYPSDRFVYPESSFLRGIARGISLAKEREDRLVVLGVRPDGPETDYGWIQPGNPIPVITDGRARDVAYFIEKPTPHAAQAAFHRGALWSTSIVVGKVRTLWKLGWRFLPEMMVRFAELRDSLDDGYDEPVLERIYRDMPTLDFSRNLVELAHKHLAVMELEDVLWSDWGSPQRILSTLDYVGVRPSFATNRRDPDSHHSAKQLEFEEGETREDTHALQS